MRSVALRKAGPLGTDHDHVFVTVVGGLHWAKIHCKEASLDATGPCSAAKEVVSEGCILIAT